MKTVFLLRHAKSDWNHPNITDFDRSLNKRGLNDAKRLNAFLAVEGYYFDKIYCSAAVRTTQTHDLVLDEAGEYVDAEFLDDLYHCNCDYILDLLKVQAKSTNTILIINHMPTIQIVYEFLSGESIGNYPTCTLSALEFEGDWGDITKIRCHKKLFLSPKRLKQSSMHD